MTHTRFLLISLFAASPLLFGCAQSDSPDVACGDSGGAFVTVSSDHFCAYDSALIIETGFRCPEGFTVQESFGELIICGERQIPDPDGLRDELDDRFSVEKLPCKPVCGPDETCNAGVCEGEETSSPGACLEFVPDTLDFGGVGIGDAKILMMSLYNSCDRELALRDITLSGSPDFQFPSSPNMFTTITSFESIDIEVSYAPTAPGSDTGEIIASFNAGTSADTWMQLRSALNGNGVENTCTPGAICNAALIDGHCSGLPAEQCACSSGFSQCSPDGQHTGCVGPDGEQVVFPFSKTEIPDNGIDDDCDGTVD